MPFDERPEQCREPEGAAQLGGNEDREATTFPDTGSGKGGEQSLLLGLANHWTYRQKPSKPLIPLRSSRLGRARPLAHRGSQRVEPGLSLFLLTDQPQLKGREQRCGQCGDQYRRIWRIQGDFADPHRQIRPSGLAEH